MPEKEMEEKESFEELLKASSETPGRRLFPGDKVSGKVLKVSKAAFMTLCQMKGFFRLFLVKKLFVIVFQESQGFCWASILCKI